MTAVRLVKEGKAHGMISAGNSGAVMASSLLILGTLKKVTRPAIAVMAPTLSGLSVVLDVGANVDSKPRHLYEFAVMGNAFSKYIMKKPDPAVGLLSIGTEEGKGDATTCEAHGLLSEGPFRFIGNIEGSDILAGRADVVVCDGFVGNILLKFSEGMTHLIKTLFKDIILSHPLQYSRTIS